MDSAVSAEPHLATAGEVGRVAEVWGGVKAETAAACRRLVARAVTRGLVRVAARASDGQFGGRASVAAAPDEQEQQVVGEH